MRNIVNRVVAFYKESILDIYKYLKYMIRQLIKYNLIVIIVTVICCLVYLFLSDTVVNYFFGVIISVIAAILFEGYRSYRRDYNNNIVLSTSITKLKYTYFNFLFLINSEDFMDVRHIIELKWGRIFLKDNPAIILKNNEDMKQVIKLIIRDLMIFNECQISDNKESLINDELYTRNLSKHVYNRTTKVLLHNIYPVLNDTLSEIMMFSDNTKFIKILIEYRNTINMIKERSLPENFHDTIYYVNYVFLIDSLRKSVKILEKIEEYEKNGKGKK